MPSTFSPQLPEFPAPSTNLNDELSRLNVAVAETDSLMRRAEGIIGVLGGHWPVPTSDEADAPTEHYLDRMQRTVSVLTATNVRLAEALRRLDTYLAGSGAERAVGAAKPWA